MTIQQAIITLIAAIISGVFATGITLYVNHRTEEIKLKQQVVSDIFGYKYQLSNAGQITNLDINSKGFVQAINRVPIIFYDEKKVLDAYDKFYDTATIRDEKERAQKMNEALIDLLKALCYSSHIKCDNWNDSRFKRVFNI